MAVILGILFAVLFIAGGLFTAYGIRLKNKNKNGSKSKIIIGVSVFVVFFGLFIFIPFGLKTVKTGEIAVVQKYGEAVKTETAGMHLVNVVSTKYVIYDLKTQEVTSQIGAYSKDAQSMEATITVQFRIQADKVLDINKEFGSLDTLTSRIRAISEERTKSVLSEDSAMDLIAKRGSLSLTVETKIKDAVKQYYIDITLVAITDITFSSVFEQTVEQKMIAEQQIAKAKYEAEQAIIKAQQDLDVAKLNAEQAIEKARGEAEARIETARGEAKALKLKSIEVARALGFTIVDVLDADGEIVDYEIDMTGKTDAEIKVITDYLKYIAYLEAWDGKLPEVIGDGSGLGLIINP
ncbi:MAG: prohibitin family protein [Clostridiales bacterium]|jgi:regulator of protease activity HflC (stomatin/prohibitin superfamily)|nr:prohibitin family protein [Clostridiales bacterium]